MNKELLKEIVSFIRERVKESFFPEERVALTNGLKLMKFSLEKYVRLQLEGFDEKELGSDSIPEVDLLRLPKSPLVQTLDKMPQLSKAEEKVMYDFSAVQLTLSVIVFEYFRTNLGREEALMYAKYLVRNIQKLKTRIGEDMPPFIEAFIRNMSVEISFLEEDIKATSNSNTSTITQDELKRINEALHYLKATSQQVKPTVQKTVHPIHFEDYSGAQFERLVFAHILRLKIWDKTPEWLGQVGSDSGRDVWAIFNGKSYCYACANYQGLTFTKVKSDIDKLKKKNFIPNHLFIVCGGVASANLRSKIVAYGKKAGAESTEVWTGVEFEEKLRFETPELIKRFVEGETFPDSASELVNYVNKVNVTSDDGIVRLIAECFDRPAFTTRFYRESSIPQFELAIARTIEVLNTGVHRLNDGTIVRTIASRHKISDEKLKSEIADITKLVVKLRDDFTELKRKKEIQPCDCDQNDCPVYMLSDKACELMDSSRNAILSRFNEIVTNFDTQLN